MLICSSFGALRKERRIGFNVSTLIKMDTIQKEQKKAKFRMRGIVATAINKIPVPSVMIDRVPGVNNALYDFFMAFSLSLIRPNSSL